MLAQWLQRCAAKSGGTGSNPSRSGCILVEDQFKKCLFMIHWVHIKEPQVVKINPMSPTMACLINVS